jgi:hypothetical protein
VSALAASIMIDSKLISFSSVAIRKQLLHAIAKMHVADRNGKKRNRYRNPEQVLHNASEVIGEFIAFSVNQLESTPRLKGGL